MQIILYVPTCPPRTTQIASTIPRGAGSTRASTRPSRIDALDEVHDEVLRVIFDVIWSVKDRPRRVVDSAARSLVSKARTTRLNGCRHALRLATSPRTTRRLSRTTHTHTLYLTHPSDARIPAQQKPLVTTTTLPARR